MKRRLIIPLVFLWAASIAVAQDATPARQLDGRIAVGGWVDDTGDAEEGVAEFEETGSGPRLKLDAMSIFGSGALFISSDVAGAYDQGHVLRFDVGDRAVRSLTTYNRMVHRLGHDPLRNLEAATTHGRQLFYTDFDPERQYETNISFFTHRTELQLPTIPALTVAAGWREKRRTGHVQSMTISHCEGCHVQSRSRELDERTRTGQVEASYNWIKGLVRAVVSTTSHRQDGPSMKNLYDDAIHPELRTAIFDNRMQYDSAQGALEYDRMPDIDKEVMRLEAEFHDVAGFVVNTAGAWSSTENRSTGLEAEFEGYSAHAVRQFGRGWRLAWRGRHYSLENEDIFIDTVEPAGTVGPHAGKTYRDVYGFNPDWLRQSVLDRDVTESRFDVGKRFGKKAGTLRLIWDYETVDREHYQVATGKTRSTTNLVGLAWSARPVRGLKVDARVDRGETEYPFMAVDATCSTLVSGPAASPLAPGSAQYFASHDARIGDTTASPAEWNEARVGGSFTRGNAMLNASYRFWEGQNDEGDLTDWSRDNQSATLTLVVTPVPTWSWYAGYTRFEGTMESPTCISVFDG